MWDVNAIAVAGVAAAGLFASTWLFCRTLGKMSLTVGVQGGEVGRALSEEELARLVGESERVDRWAEPASDNQLTYGDVTPGDF